MRWSLSYSAKLLSVIILVNLECSVADDDFLRSNESFYSIFAPGIVRPGIVYSLAISLDKFAPAMEVQASLISDGRNMALSEELVVDSGLTEMVSMKVPESITGNRFELLVTGKPIFGSSRSQINHRQSLTFSSKFLSIIVQMNRPAYMNGQKVLIRVVILNMDLLPYTDPVTVSIHDAHGFLARRWLSRYSTNGIPSVYRWNSVKTGNVFRPTGLSGVWQNENWIGVISLEYILPRLAKVGTWNIRVDAANQIQEQPFVVEEFFYPVFEFFVYSPAYLPETEETFETGINTLFHTNWVQFGNVSVATLVQSPGSDNFLEISWTNFTWTGSFNFPTEMQAIRDVVGTNLAGTHVRFEATLYDSFRGEARRGYSITKIIPSGPRLELLGVGVLKPGLPLDGFVVISNSDSSKIESDRLSAGSLSVRMRVSTVAQGTYLDELGISKDTGEEADAFASYVTSLRLEDFWNTGVFRFTFFPPAGATSVDLEAVFSEESRRTVKALTLPAENSPSGVHVSVHTSTLSATIGSYAVFHFRSTMPIESFTYMIHGLCVMKLLDVQWLTLQNLVIDTDKPTALIMSKGVLLTADQLLTENSGVTTFAVPVGRSMAPSFQVIVNCNIKNHQYGDSVTVPVEEISLYKTNVTLNDVRDHSKKTVQVITRTEIGAFVGVSVLRQLQLEVQGGHTMHKGRVIRAMLELEQASGSLPDIMVEVDRNGVRPPKLRLFPSKNMEGDFGQFLRSIGISFGSSHGILGYQGCSNEESHTCHGPLMRTKELDILDEVNKFRFDRINRHSDCYDPFDGDWLWFDVPISDDGFEFAQKGVAKADDTWLVDAFSVHPDLGISFVDDLTETTSNPPFYIFLFGSTYVRRGETPSVKVTIISNQERELDCRLIVEASDDFGIIEVEEHGEVESYRPRYRMGEFQHFVSVPGLSLVEVPIPIVPLIDKGTITIKAYVVTQLTRDDASMDITIEPEGVVLHRHTSLLLDLKSRATLFRYLDIPVEDTPVIPFIKPRRFVFGSPRGHVTISGDVFGPIPEDLPAPGANAFKRILSGVESCIYALGYNLWTLHYLRLTRQLDFQFAKQGFEKMNLALAELSLYWRDPGYSHYRGGLPSLWSSAWVLKILGQSQFQEWENHFTVDPELLSRGCLWMGDQQLPDGSFATDSVADGRMFRVDSEMSGILSLTGHVTLALHYAGMEANGATKTIISTIKTKALTFLERNYFKSKDPSTLALLTHVFTVTTSPLRETAFGELHAMRIDEGNFIYWSRQPVEHNKVIYENQRPFIQPRGPSNFSTPAIEATSYALLVYLMRDGIDVNQEKIMTWLNNMRMHDEGFASSVDTLVAMEALCEFAYRARLREVTALSIRVESPANSNADWTCDIREDSLSKLHKFELDNVWGFLSLTGKGAGMAVAQADVSYGVDWIEYLDRPKQKVFDLSIWEEYSDFRNKSHVDVNACFRWTMSDTSGPAVLELEIPTGYGVVHSDAYQFLENQNLPFLSDVEPNDRVVYWYFDYVPNERNCLRYQLRRWYAVANLTQFRSAKISEVYNPENFELVLVDAKSLYVLDICEVCGSYQCPYCYIYSGASMVTSIAFTYVACFVLYILICNSSDIRH